MLSAETTNIHSLPIQQHTHHTLTPKSRTSSSECCTIPYCLLPDLTPIPESLQHLSCLSSSLEPQPCNLNSLHHEAHVCLVANVSVQVQRIPWNFCQNQLYWAQTALYLGSQSRQPLELLGPSSRASLQNPWTSGLLLWNYILITILGKPYSSLCKTHYVIMVT